MRGQPAAPGRDAGVASPVGVDAATVAVIGLGYVGLPLAVEFANAGFTVTGLSSI